MSGILVRPGAGGGVVVPAEATGGVVSFIEQVMPARHLIPGHVHERTDVWIYVLDGLVGARVADDEVVGEKGNYLLKPRGVPHAMWNPSDSENRFIEILTPGSGDAFFADAARLSPDATREEFEAMCARHGIHWFDDWTEDLRARYSLV
jgi:quercetin dioxygenase-like cupin family protein